METTPHSLLQRLGKGPVPVRLTDWERFVELFTPLLFSWARRLNVAKQDVKDLVHDVFLVVMEKLPELEVDKNQNFRGWLRTILRNRYHDRFRKPPPTPVDPDQLTMVQQPDEESIAEGEYRKFLLQRALQLMQTDFEENTWRACWLTKACGQSTSEAAAELGMTVAGVHGATYRVLHRLRSELKGFLDI